MYMSISYWEASNWAQYATCGLSSAEQRGRVTSLDLLVIFCLMQPRILLALLWGKGTLLPPVQPGVHQDPQVFFCQAAFQPGGPQHILVHGFVPPQVQDCALLFVELDEVPVSPFLQPVVVPLDGSTTVGCISHSSQFDVICKLAESILCPVRWIINDDVKWDWIQCWPQRYTASYWPPTRLCSTDQHPLGPDLESVFSPPHCLLIQFLHQLLV